MTNNKPNLFHYATKELSQDAFLCWLIKWSETEYQSINPKLHLLAKELVASFIGITPDELHIDKINIERQVKGIDIVLRFDKYLIGIEDKVNAEIGNRQLLRYCETLNKKAKGELIPIGIFIKTYVIRADERQKAEDAKFKVYDIKVIRELFLRHEEIENEIYDDFKSHIEKVYRDLFEFYKKPTTKWNKNNYYGFYLCLKEELEFISDFKTFRKGDAFWFTLFTKAIPGLPSIKLEVKEKKLILLATVQKGEYPDLMKVIYPIFPKENNKVKKKNKKGKYLSLYVFPKLLITAENDFLNLSETIDFLKSTIQDLDSLETTTE